MSENLPDNVDTLQNPLLIGELLHHEVRDIGAGDVGTVAWKGFAVETGSVPPPVFEQHIDLWIKGGVGPFVEMGNQ